VQQHLPGDVGCKSPRRTFVAALDRHQRRRDDEMQRIFKADNQGHGNGSLLAERQQRQTGTHVADIAVSTGKGLDRAVGQRIAAQEASDQEQQQEDQICRGNVGDDEIGARQLLDRRLRDELEEQGRQRGIDDKGIEPAERLATVS
jgi:hypothetical protein